nr:hypothetical protein GCM10020092_005590 [Actinoplanes digitatis]
MALTCPRRARPSRIVVTAGYRFRSQPAAGGSWAAWQEIQTSSTRIDHVSLVATSDSFYAIGLDWTCDINCDVWAARFNDSQQSFGGRWRPGGVFGAAQLSPIGVAGHGTAASAAVKGTDGNIWFQPAGQCGVVVCTSSWLNAGSPPTGTVNQPVLAVTPDYTYIVASTVNGKTYYQLFWHDDWALSGGWVALT